MVDGLTMRASTLLSRKSICIFLSLEEIASGGVAIRHSDPTGSLGWRDAMVRRLVSAQWRRPAVALSRRDGDGVGIS
jgi:hypothetical protein